MTSLGRESGNDAIFDPNIYSARLRAETRALESNGSRDSGTSRIKYGKYADIKPSVHATVTATEVAGLNEITR